MIELEGHRACAKCQGLFSLEKGKLRAVDRPDGITLEWDLREGVRCVIVASSQRSGWSLLPARIALLLGAGLMFFSAALGATAIRQVGHWTLTDGALPGVVGLALSALALMVLGLLPASRTSIAVSPNDIDVRRGALRWSAPSRLERAGAVLRIGRVPGFHVPPLSLRRPARTSSMRCPSVDRYQVHLVSEDRGTAILLDGLPSVAAAERARIVIGRVLTATAPRWRIAAPTDATTPDEALEAAAPTSRARRR
jgi:hypothetical protein